tara:strand:+ start:1521 stop:1838 length:318 start_codon:yes stop_codon:yes gene_type:complete
MKRIYQAKDDIEAQLIIDYLKQSSVEAVVFDQYQSGAAGELSAVKFPWIWLLRPKDFPYAKQLIDQYQENDNRDNNEISWECGNCDLLIEGQFNICWNCGCIRQK